MTTNEQLRKTFVSGLKTMLYCTSGCGCTNNKKYHERGREVLLLVLEKADLLGEDVDTKKEDIVTSFFVSPKPPPSLQSITSHVIFVDIFLWISRPLL